MGNREIRLGIILSYLSQAIQIVVGLVYTPIMISILGQSEYGVYQLVYSTVANLNLIGLGFGASYVRFYNIENTKTDVTAVPRLNGLYMLVYCIMSFICLVSGWMMISNIHVLFADGLKQQEYNTATVLMIILVINMVVTFPASLFDSWIQVHERFVFIKALIVIQNLLTPLLTLPLLLMGYGSVSLVIISTVITFVKILISIFYSFKRLNLEISFRNLDIHKLKEIAPFTFFIFLNQIIDQINWSVDKYLLGRISGTVAVAVYGVASQLNNMFTQFSVSISNVFIPKVNRLVVERRERELNNLFVKVGRIQCMIISLIYCGFIVYGKLFIELWVGPQYEESYVTALLLISGIYVPLLQNLGIEIQRAKNKHKVRSVVYSCISICNVIISVFLIKIFGVKGAALGTMLALLIGNVFFMNWYYKTHLDIDIYRFFKSILPIIPVMLITSVVGILYQRIFTVRNYLVFISGIILFTMVYILLLWIIFMNDDEKGIIKRRIIQKLKKKS